MSDECSQWQAEAYEAYADLPKAEDYVAAFAELKLPPPLGFQKHVNVEITSCDVDPEMLRILFGGYGPDGVQHGLTVYAPIKRTFWQWLLRKPIQQRVTHFPHVKFLIEREDKTCGT